MRKSIYALLVTALSMNAMVQYSFAGNNAGQSFSLWPDTGQGACYNASGVVITCPSAGQPLAGQDAQYAGQVRSYTKLDADGNALPDNSPSWIMVRDNITGLIWEAKQAKDGVKNYTNINDADNTYWWCDTNPDTNGGNQGACGSTDTEDFLTVLNTPPGFGGHTDWRLPTIKELVTLADMGREFPALNLTFFPNTINDNYWSSTTNVINPGRAWIMYVREGVLWVQTFDNKSNSYYVRAVRGGL